MPHTPSLRRALVPLTLAMPLALLSTATAAAQVVQLPEFGFFTVDTTVSVPDGGAAYLGGIGSTATGSTTRGVPLLGRVPGLNRGFQNRAIGRTTSAGGVSVHATILDMAEMDEAVLAAAAGPTPAQEQAAAHNERARQLAGQVEQPQGEAPLLSVAEIRRQHEQAAQAESAEVARHYAAAQAAEAEGKYGVARVYYRLALRDATGPMAEEISARLLAISSPGQSGR